MPPKSLGELAHSLSEQERRELNERIQRSLSLQKKDQAGIYHTQLAPDVREQLIRQGLQELGVWQRFLLWMQKVFGGRTEENAFVDLKLKEIARHMLADNLADPASRTVLEGSAERIWRLHAKIVPLQDFFHHVCGSERALREAVQLVLSRRIPKAKNGLKDFFSDEELETFFTQTESKVAMVQELVNRINTYLEGIPADIFSEIEEGILPLYYLKELVGFNFAELFRFFKVDIKNLGANTPVFKLAQVDQVLETLEHLYFAIHSAKKLGPNDSIHPELFEFYQDLKNRKQEPPSVGLGNALLEPMSEDEAEDGPGLQGAAELFMVTPEAIEKAPGAEEPKPGPEKDEVKKAAEAAQESSLKNLRKALRDLRKDLDLYLDQSLLPDLIRFFQADPYYRFIAYVPTLNLRDFYWASIRMSLIERLDGEYLSIRRRVIKRLLASIFRNGLKEFDNLRKIPTGFARSGLPIIRYVDTLAILYNYQVATFLTYTKDMLRLLLKAIPGRGRDGFSSLPYHIEAMEELFEKVRGYDNAFGPEGNDGKQLVRIRATLDRDINQERNYRLFAASKEKELRTAVEEGIEHLKSLAEGVEEAIKLPVDVFNERFQQASGMITQSSYHAMFVAIVRELRDVHRAMRYQRVLEEEQL